MNRTPSGLEHSVQVRLVDHAKAIGTDPNHLLNRYAIERFLYRLSRSPHSERFVLKGAFLLFVWLGERIRPTRDADFLGLGNLSDKSLATIFASICSIDVEADGMIYEPSTIRVTNIRQENTYGGMRVSLLGHLGPARLHVQCDIGLGDAVTPEPEWVEYPSLLGFPSPRLRAYRPETTIAEKLHAMVILGSTNTRMRDFFDIYLLAERRSFDGSLLTAAVRDTFKRRRTQVPEALPFALKSEFSALEGKQAQWQAFLRKNALTVAPESLADVAGQLARFLLPVIEAAGQDRPFANTWRPSGPWRPDKSGARSKE